MSNREEIIAELAAEGITTAKKARGYLAFKYDFNAKETTEILVEAGISGVRSNGLGSEGINLWLSELPRTESELYQKIFADGSPNECRWIKVFNGIRELSIRIYARLGEEFTEEAASAELIKEVAARVPAPKTK